MKIALLFALLVGFPCAAESWISIATPSAPYQYFLYSNSGAIEKDKFDAQNPHPQKSFTYKFPPGPSAARTTCRLEDRPADHVFWYAPPVANSSATHLDGMFATPLASEFNVSELQKNIRGFEALAIFGGSSKSPGGALESIYFTDRACSDGGVEYGLARDLATDNLLVYWSTYSNCGNDAGSACRKTNDPTLGDNFSNVQQESDRAPHGFRIYDLDLNRQYLFRMTIENDGFQVDIFSDGDKLALCRESGGQPLMPCSFHKPAPSWFPVHKVSSGYIVAGALDVAGSDISRDAGLQIADILVNK